MNLHLVSTTGAAPPESVSEGALSLVCKVQTTNPAVNASNLADALTEETGIAKYRINKALTSLNSGNPLPERACPISILVDGLKAVLKSLETDPFSINGQTTIDPDPIRTFLQERGISFSQAAQIMEWTASQLGMLRNERLISVNRVQYEAWLELRQNLKDSAYVSFLQAAIADKQYRHKSKTPPPLKGSTPGVDPHWILPTNRGAHYGWTESPGFYALSNQAGGVQKKARIPNEDPSIWDSYGNFPKRRYPLNFKSRK
ncbi:hypothetical protein HN748_03695 [Candidatus Peregrinibacteria bacterium]|nr:hypothetical protein [Candidatus Peregrinibacteria bacterium]MBT7703312.1 hypothetical protein [Candidatus Peregrinibacteria bacterium]